jgi:hypothetical protein
VLTIANELPRWVVPSLEELTEQKDGEEDAEGKKTKSKGQDQGRTT